MELETRPPAPSAQESTDPVSALERRDWELWSIALILLTVVAGGVVTFAYLATRGDEQASPWVLRLLWLLLFALIALVLLLNIYLIDKKRTLAQLRRRTLAQEIELEEQRAHAVTDSLTHVYNRRFFDEVVPKEVRRAVRANRPFSVLLVDIDGFRQINATLGHLVGDELLRQVADALRNSLRVSDYLFRFGGDEFLVVLPETDEAATAVVTQRLHQALAARGDLHQRVGRPLTVTIGPATFLAGRSLESVLEEAETNVHAARREFSQP
ncbi:MAG: GGDEF domain-containing protein [Terriglobia bacterium]